MKLWHQAGILWQSCPLRCLARRSSRCVCSIIEQLGADTRLLIAGTYSIGRKTGFQVVPRCPAKCPQAAPPNPLTAGVLAPLGAWLAATPPYTLAVRVLAPPGAQLATAPPYPLAVGVLAPPGAQLAAAPPYTLAVGVLATTGA
ncbi:hypothetical protein HaLaN_08220 [Haematococcus lacustris]|uniref:Uncharacterized protein n=1 Tax=Haematococcus lacustris TaxID=44745 RepID=A0A699YTF6_HAELA|nr:hypothetical protein HaLaN_08220 [Haematococcus lacustris]